jgi:hypothetical protein
MKKRKQRRKNYVRIAYDLHALKGGYALPLERGFVVDKLFALVLAKRNEQ